MTSCCPRSGACRRRGEPSAWRRCTSSQAPPPRGAQEGGAEKIDEVADVLRELRDAWARSRAERPGATSRTVRAAPRPRRARARAGARGACGRARGAPRRAGRAGGRATRAPAARRPPSCSAKPSRCRGDGARLRTACAPCAPSWGRPFWTRAMEPCAATRRPAGGGALTAAASSFPGRRRVSLFEGLPRPAGPGVPEKRDPGVPLKVAPPRSITRLACPAEGATPNASMETAEGLLPVNLSSTRRRPSRRGRSLPARRAPGDPHQEHRERERPELPSARTWTSTPRCAGRWPGRRGPERSPSPRPTPPPAARGRRRRGRGRGGRRPGPQRP